MLKDLPAPLRVWNSKGFRLAMNSVPSTGLSQGKKQLLEFTPLVFFFAAYWFFGFIWASAVLVMATVIAMAAIYRYEGTLSKMQIFTTSLVVVFGGLTVVFKDPAFLKIKVSIINLIFSGALFGGLAFGQLFIRDIMGASMQLPDFAWRTLTIRWALFFAALAILNLVVWYLFSEGVWATFKFVGLLGLTAVFALANAPYMARHMIADQDNKPSANG
jgi:intracellular septation protein